MVAWRFSSRARFFGVALLSGDPFLQRCLPIITLLVNSGPFTLAASSHSLPRLVADSIILGPLPSCLEPPIGPKLN